MSNKLNAQPASSADICLAVRPPFNRSFGPFDVMFDILSVFFALSPIISESVETTISSAKLALRGFSEGLEDFVVCGVLLDASDKINHNLQRH